LDPGISKGKWTLDEDTKLTEAVMKHGKNWAQVAALIPGRLNSQCRQRWLASLDPALDRTYTCRQRWLASLDPALERTYAHKWTVEEDATLIEAVTERGQNWPLVAALVSGRTNVQCRQRWLTTLDPAIARAHALHGQWKKTQT
jgi:myb proto-oncogene protein